MREVKIPLAKIPCLSFCLIARFISYSLPHLFNRDNAIHTCKSASVVFIRNTLGFTALF